MQSLLYYYITNSHFFQQYYIVLLARHVVNSFVDASNYFLEMFFAFDLILIMIE